MATRIIFLDIDGVLNRTKKATHIRIDADLVDLLRGLVEETGARIVLSTFWRHFTEYITYVLTRHGIPAETVIGRTPGTSDASKLSADPADEGNYANRAAEIRAWRGAARRRAPGRSYSQFGVPGGYIPSQCTEK